ncbi:MAG: HAD hydrolase family protein [Verrucomicrobiota bacterium]|nr:HAD hydrolase family protein [Verrucomicrobiota bacterium]
MPNTLKLMCTDFDGTIYDESVRPPIPATFLESVANMQESGICWMVNTGREKDFLLESLREHGSGLLPDYIGVVERELYVLKSGNYTPLEYWNLASKKTHASLFERHTNLMIDIRRWINTSFDADIYEDEHSPICLIARNNGDADAIHAHVQEALIDHPELSWVRNDVYARFSHAKIHKGTLLKQVAKLQQIPASRILAAGDHLNDLPMLHPEYAAHLVAPANSVPEVRHQVSEHGGYISSGIAGWGIQEALLTKGFGGR